MNTLKNTKPQSDQITNPATPSDSSPLELGGATLQELYTLIAQQPFFKGFNEHQLQILADSAMKMRFEAGQSIFDEGSPANRFYIILKGKVVLESELENRNKIAIQTLGPGDDLGWSWLFPPFYIHLSARALEATETIFFYGTRLRDQCEQDHELGYQLMTRIAEVATQCLKATQLRLAVCADTNKISDKS
jgi:CRP/FNR family cyclic AMP-dependent transcriptional regulator